MILPTKVNLITNHMLTPFISLLMAPLLLCFYGFFHGYRRRLKIIQKTNTHNNSIPKRICFCLGRQPSNAFLSKLPTQIPSETSPKREKSCRSSPQQAFEYNFFSNPVQMTDHVIPPSIYVSQKSLLVCPHFNTSYTSLLIQIHFKSRWRPLPSPSPTLRNPLKSTMLLSPLSSLSSLLSTTLPPIRRL